MKRIVMLAGILQLGVLMVGSASVPGAHATPAPDRSWDTPPPLRLDSLHFRAEEAAVELFRQGCLEAKVVAWPDPQGKIQVYASCLEWQQFRPASE